MVRIIDAHCHIYPDGIALKAVKAVDEFYDKLPGCKHDGTIGTLLSTGNACGISHFLVHSVATTPHQVSSINSFLARAVRESGGCFTGMGTMHPDSQDYDADLDEICSLGLKGVKLHPDIQKFPLDDRRAMAIFERIEDRGLPVLVHTGDHRYDYSNPDRVLKVLEAFPKLKFIGAHFGGWSVWEEAARKLAGYDNLMVDSSSSFPWLKPEQAKELFAAFGCGRVLFGTDYPFWDQQKEIDFLLSLGFREEEYEQIFWKNMAGVFGLAF